MVSQILQLMTTTVARSILLPFYCVTTSNNARNQRLITRNESVNKSILCLNGLKLGSEEDQSQKLRSYLFTMKRKLGPIRYQTKGKLELNSKKVELECCKKFSYMHIFLFALKARLQLFKFELCHIKLGRTAGKLAINWQNFALSWTQLEFAFTIRRLVLSS